MSMPKAKTKQFYIDQINSLNRIPSLPAIATELMQVTHEDDLSVNQLLPIIERDPPLAMKVLKIANSAYYGMTRKVESLRHAIVMMGMQELRDLSLGFSVIHSLAQENSKSSLNWQMLWEHSAAVGHISQLLLERLGLQTKSSPYALGLLHDIGKIVLYRIDPDEYKMVVEYSLEKNISSRSAEIELLGVDHMQIGAWVAEKWQLPQSIIEAIRFHHEPELVSEPDILISTSLIQLADIVANLQSISFGINWVQSVPREEAGWKNLKKISANMADLDFERFVMSIDDELGSIKEMVKMMGRG